MKLIVTLEVSMEDRAAFREYYDDMTIAEVVEEELKDLDVEGCMIEVDRVAPIRSFRKVDNLIGVRS